MALIPSVMPLKEYSRSSLLDSKFQSIERLHFFPPPCQWQMHIFMIRFKHSEKPLALSNLVSTLPSVRMLPVALNEYSVIKFHQSSWEPESKLSITATPNYWAHTRSHLIMYIPLLIIMCLTVRLSAFNNLYNYVQPAVKNLRFNANQGFIDLLRKPPSET